MSANRKSVVYVEVTVPSEHGEPVGFFTEEFTTEELDVKAIHDMLVKSEKAVVEGLGLRHKPK